MASPTQLGLPFFLLISVPSVAASLLTAIGMKTGQPLGQHAITKLVLEPLRGHDILLVLDDLSRSLIDLDWVIRAAEPFHNTPVILSTQDSLLHNILPAQNTKGSLLTAILVFYEDPTDFFDLLGANMEWNPGYLVLVCLNPHLSTTSVLSQPVLQRSRFILLLQLVYHRGKLRIEAFTSIPFKRNSHGRFLTRAPMGAWDPEARKSRCSAFPDRFHDFGGKVLEVPVVCHDNPFLYYGKDSKCIGANPYILQMMGDKLNFTLITTKVLNHQWGFKMNGTWHGVLGKLMYYGKHMMLNSNQITPESAQEFDWTYPFWEYYFAITVHLPPPLPLWRNILYPFSTLTWILVIVTTIVSAFILSLLVYWMRYTNDPVGFALKVSAGIVNQPMPDAEIRVWWARVWLVFWWVAVDILAAAYMSNLITVLTVPAFPPRIHTAEQLSKSHVIPSMLNYGSFVPLALKSSKNPILATLGRRLFLDNVLLEADPYNYLVGKVLAGTHALICSNDYLWFTLHRHKVTRKVYLLKDKLYSYYMNWFLPKHTPYTPIITALQQRFFETGILTKVYRMHTGYSAGGDEVVRGTGVLNVGHLQGALILLGIGLAISVVCFLLERYI